MLRATKNLFDEEYNATVGVDYGAKTFQMHGKELKLEIWDAAGQM